MGRTYACVSAAIVALGTLTLAGLQGCSLMSLAAFDAVADASRGPGRDASDGSIEASESAAGDSAPEASEEDSPAATDEEQTSDDASEDSQGPGAPDVAIPSEAGDAGGGDSGSDATADAGPAPPPPCTSSVLVPKTAVASSVQPAGPGTIALPASYAIDNDFTTRWGSALQTDPSWIYMDFGAPVFVSEVDLLWQDACGANYDIDISTDATHWTVMKTVAGNTVGDAVPATMAWNATQVLKYPGLSGRGRYVRVNGTARCIAMYGYSLWEMRALGDTVSTCTN
jgi:F5/8 type C domain